MPKARKLRNRCWGTSQAGLGRRIAVGAAAVSLSLWEQDHPGWPQKMPELWLAAPVLYRRLISPMCLPPLPSQTQQNYGSTLSFFSAVEER